MNDAPTPPLAKADALEAEEVMPVVKGRIIRPQITIERDDPSGWPSGDRFIWARFAEAPSMDALLVTVHYRYGFQDNGTIQGIAERVAAALQPPPQDDGADPRCQCCKQIVGAELLDGGLCENCYGYVVDAQLDAMAEARAPTPQPSDVAGKLVAALDRLAAQTRSYAAGKSGTPILGKILNEADEVIAEARASGVGGEG